MTVWVHSPFDNLPHEGFRRQRYWLMAEAFAAKGDTVLYLTGDFNHGTKTKRVFSTPINSPVDVRLIPVLSYRMNVSLRRVLSHVLYARRLKKTLVGRPDLIISATPLLGAAEVLLNYARSVGARFVLDVQDAWPETFGRLGIPQPFLSPLYRVARRLYREADRVTGVSERYREIVARDDYTVFYHGILPQKLPSAAIPASPYSLVYAGNLGEGYDLATVLKALARDSRLTLDIAGKGPREAELKALTVSLGLTARVRFHGYLGADALARLLSSARAGIIPMRDDSWVALPYKLGDYLVAGIPVLSSLHGECGALLERGGLGVTYDFADPESFLAAFARLPRASVVLPDLLNAELIYPKYADLLRY